MNANWLFDVTGISISFSDGQTTYDADDRVRIRHGTLVTVVVRREANDEISTLQLFRLLKKASNLQDPRPSRAPHLSSPGASAAVGSDLVQQSFEPEPEDGHPNGDEDPDGEDDPDDDPDDSDVQYHTGHVYHHQDDYFSMQIDDTSLDTNMEQISDHWGLRHREIVAAHIVASPPSDHADPEEQVFIAELVQDADFRPLQTDILGLVDVEFQSTADADRPVHLRKVLWLRSTSTRAGVLYQLRSFDLCYHRPNFACVLHVNQVHWPDGDTALRHFISGDYFRLVISCPTGTAPCDAAQDMREFERTEARRHVFRQPNSPDGSSDEQSEHGSTLTFHSEEPPASDGFSTHVLDRLCWDDCSVAGDGSKVTPPCLFSLVDSLAYLAPWKSKLSVANFNSQEVSDLRDFLVSIPPWPESAFSQEWNQIPEAHEFVALIDQFQTPISAVGDFHIFLDGSYLPSNGAEAWAFSVVLRSNEGAFYRWGFTGGCIEDSIGSLHAEAFAFATALDWICSSLVDSLRPIHIYGDATAVGFGADGSQKLANGLDDLGRLTRTLFCLAQSALPEVAFHHVKAHCGQMDNELVDSVAKALAKQAWSPHRGVPHPSRWFEAPFLSWSWLLVENFMPGPSSLPSLDDLVSCKALPSVPQPATDPFAASPEVGHDQKNPTHVTLRLGSANVRSLKETKMVNSLSDKTELLGAQMKKYNYDILAVQESRSYQDKTSTFMGIFRFSAAASQGQGGVELWVNPGGSLAASDFGPLKPTHFHILSTSSTWMLASCDHPLLRCTFCVAYAPQSGRDPNEISGWWRAFHQLLLAYRTHDLVLLGDFNAHIGAVETSGIGNHQWNSENLAGSYFREVVEDLRLLVPSTLSQYHVGGSMTFRSASGGCTRVDYIVVPEAWETGIKQSYVDIDFDLLSGDFDHFLVALEMEMNIVPVSEVYRPRRPVYDRQAAVDNPLLLRQMLQTIPHVAWGIGVDQHWEVIERHCTRFVKKHFPLQKRHVRQTYFSSTTWNLLTSRKDVEIQIRDADKGINRWWLFRFFGLWRGTISAKSITTLDGSLSLIHCFQERALLLWARATLDCRFRKSRKDDLLNYRTTCSLDFRQHVGFGDSTSLFKALRPKRPVQRPRPLPALDLSSADSAVGVRLQCVRVWEAHFAQVEHSKVANKQEIMDFASAFQTTTLDAGFNLEDVPGLQIFENATRQLSWRKAPGFDGLGAECWQHGMEACKQHLYALFLKSAARRYLPIQFRGGFLIPLFKNRGSAMDPSSFRGILLQNTCAKIFAKTWRVQLAKHLDRQAAPLQLGCRKGLGVTGAHLPLRLHLDTCAANSQSVGIIFIDVQAAYYSVVKELYNEHPAYNSEAFLRSLFAKLNLPSSATEDFVDYVGRTSLLKDAGVSETLAAIVQSTLEKSWYQLPSSPDLFAPATGTRPGDPLADVLFSFAMADVLWEVNQALMADPDLLQLPPDLPLGTTWADDTCIFLCGEASSLESRIAIAFSTIQESFTKRGLTLSYGPHKTAVIIAFRGQDGKFHHRRLFSHDRPAIACCLEYSDVTLINAYFTYKHLGSVVDASGSLMPEIKARGGKAVHAVRSLVSSCLSKECIPLQRRRLILKSLALSTLTHNVGAWRCLSTGEFDAWSSYVWKLYCFLIPRSYAEAHPHISMEYAASVADGFLPAALLHACRLRLLCQVLQHPDEGLISSIEANWTSCGSTSWWACVQMAISWLCSVSGGASVCPALQRITEPSALAYPEPGLAEGIKKALRKAQCTNRHFLQQWIALDQADRVMRATLEQHGWKVPSPKMADDRVSCPSCSKHFRDEASLATHRFKAHGQRVAARRFASSTTCDACGNNFSTRPRLIVHLQYSSKRCLPWLLLHAKPIEEYTAASLDAEAAVALLQERRTGIKSSASRMPSSKTGIIQVPEVTIAPLEASDRPMVAGIGPPTERQLQFVARWLDTEGLWPLEEAKWWVFVEELIIEVLECPFHCYQSFSGRVIDLIDAVGWRQDDFEVVLDLQDRLAAVLHAYTPHRQPARKPFKSREERLRDWEREYGSLPVWMGLRASSSRPRQAHDDASDFPERLADMEHSWQNEVHLWHAPPPDSVPRSCFPVELFYLILFSGHRREDDIASQVWRLDFGSRQVWPICLDLCLDEHGGNLLNPATLDFWKGQVLQRRVIGFHASPPCETFTEARFLPPPEGRDRPRPLRSWTFPWSLPGLDCREIRQLATGNSLLCVAVMMAVWTLVAGGCATLEHPSGKSPAEGRFTIWYSAFLRRLGRFEHCNQFSFQQGYLGQVSRKPTTFLLLRMGSFPRFVRTLSTHSGPFQTLQGMTDNGWATSRAKEFPPALCQAIALALQAFCLASPHRHSDAPLIWPEVPLCTWSPYDRYGGLSEGTTMRPDFWG